MNIPALIIALKAAPVTAETLQTTINSQLTAAGLASGSASAAQALSIIRSMGAVITTTTNGSGDTLYAITT